MPKLRGIISLRDFVWFPIFSFTVFHNLISFFWLFDVFSIVREKKRKSNLCAKRKNLTWTTSCSEDKCRNLGLIFTLLIFLKKFLFRYFISVFISSFINLVLYFWYLISIIIKRSYILFWIQNLGFVA